MNNEWLYQVRIKLSQDLADDLRSDSNLDISKGINKIARKHQTRPVCTLDGFLDYVKEAEKNDIKDYPLYHCCLLYTSPSPRDKRQSRMPSSA